MDQALVIVIEKLCNSQTACKLMYHGRQSRRAPGTCTACLQMLTAARQLLGSLQHDRSKDMCGRRARCLLPAPLSLSVYVRVLCGKHI
eukprot:364505-Chlamydomonas_euryale.AAC.16